VTASGRQGELHCDRWPGPGRARAGTKARSVRPAGFAIRQHLPAIVWARRRSVIAGRVGRVANCADRGLGAGVWNRRIARNSPCHSVQWLAGGVRAPCELAPFASSRPLRVAPLANSLPLRARAPCELAPLANSRPLRTRALCELAPFANSLPLRARALGACPRLVWRTGMRHSFTRHSGTRSAAHGGLGDSGSPPMGLRQT
jgi:hypothetical protein